MEVFIRDEGRFALERVDPNDKIVLPDGSTSIGFTRKAYLPPIRVTKALLDRLRFVGPPPKVEIDQSTAGLEVSVGFLGTADPGKLISTIQLAGGSQFLQSLFGHESDYSKGLQGAIKVQLEVVSIAWEPPNMSTPIYYRPVEKPLLSSIGQDEDEAKRVEFKSTINMDQMIPNWNSGTWEISARVKLVPSRWIGDVTVAIIASREMGLRENPAYTKVISQNGTAIRFHRSVLAAHSPAFERMFQTKMQEGTSDVLELPDMTEDSVWALQEYFFRWDWRILQENSLICFELFEAGHKYGISMLERETYNIFMTMDGAWYSAVVALRLFLFVKDMGLPSLKQKAVEVLKLKREEVMKLKQYRDLLEKENDTVAKELTGYLSP